MIFNPVENPSDSICLDCGILTEGESGKSAVEGEKGEEICVNCGSSAYPMEDDSEEGCSVMSETYAQKIYSEYHKDKQEGKEEEFKFYFYSKFGYGSMREYFESEND